MKRRKSQMKIQYLTWLHEKTGKHEDDVDLPDTIQNIEGLIDYLERSKPECETVFKNRQVIYTAVNDEIRQSEFPIKNTDKISFFSAVVGG